MAYRLRGRFGYPEDEPFRVTLHPERLDEPLRWRKPRKVFVCSMGDLFHPDVPFSFITQVFDVMCSWRWPNKAAEQDGDASLLEDPGHTFIVLTKRPERILLWLDWVQNYWPGDSPFIANLDCGHFGKHIWIGVTAENQKTADERIPLLLQTPAAVRFVSVEPMFGRVDLSKWLGVCKSCGSPATRCGPDLWNKGKKCCPDCTHTGVYLDWVICGGETGPRARPMHPDWVRSLRDQCQEAGVPFFFKQWGVYIPAYEAGYRSEETDSYGKTFGYRWVHSSVEVDGLHMVKVGRKAAGRLLDGRTWDEFPLMKKHTKEAWRCG